LLLETEKRGGGGRRKRGEGEGRRKSEERGRRKRDITTTGREICSLS
jgi:hypothetical protein